ncbi:CBS domain-containing protein [Methanolobus sp. ZRKC4]|uniref:CBS domain-containing protein n=1 Tax=Methanolobus sp. ZRKC4 TaxID=3125787 RepID=UPI00324F5E19
MPKNIKVSEIMKTNVAYATLPGSRDEVHTLLKDKKVSGVPVLKDGKIVGLSAGQICLEILKRNSWLC